MSTKGKGGCCSAIGCSKRQNTNLLSKVKVFRFPRDPVRRAAWASALRRENFVPTDHTVICNDHFVTGKPSSDPNHPDYIPSLFSFIEDAVSCGKKKLLRYERHSNRSDDTEKENIPEKRQRICEDYQCDDSQCDNSQILMDFTRKNVEIQTDVTMQDIYEMEKKISNHKEEIKQKEEENADMRKKLIFTSPYNGIIDKNDKIFSFHTGIVKKSIFFLLLNSLIATWKPKTKVNLQPCEQFLLTLMKLRLGLKNQDLAVRFGIGVGTVSKVFHEWLDVLFLNLKGLIIWPSKKMVKRSLPECFKQTLLQNVCCIIDCSEIFIEKPKNLLARAQTYSNYKSHNTIKFLIAITPSGSISFISRAWGGRVSDRNLTQQSGFLDLIKKDDVILADRGFRVDDLIASKGAKLMIPATTKGKAQLSAKEVISSRKMSRVRVHVERAIRRIKVFKILEGTLPITLVKNSYESKFATIDKILCVVSALCNIGSPLINK